MSTMQCFMKVDITHARASTRIRSSESHQRAKGSYRQLAGLQGLGPSASFPKP